MRREVTGAYGDSHQAEADAVVDVEEALHELRARWGGEARDVVA